MPWASVVNDFNDEEINEKFYEKELQKKQTKKN